MCKFKQLVQSCLKLRSKMKATYRNSIRSKELIREALITLLDKEKDITDISVTDIVKVANINRGTFYNHYSNVIEVIEEMEQELFGELLPCIKQNSTHYDVSRILHTLLDYFKKNEFKYKPIVKGLSKSAIDNLILKFISQIKTVIPDADEILLLFIINGLAGIYFDYLEEKISKNLDEICKQCISIINKIIS